MVVLKEPKISVSVHKPKITFDNSTAIATCHCGWKAKGSLGDEKFDTAFYNHSQLGR